MTSNEQVNYFRLEYFYDNDDDPEKQSLTQKGEFNNPYDKGAFRNFLHFFGLVRN